MRRVGLLGVALLFVVFGGVEVTRARLENSVALRDSLEAGLSSQLGVPAEAGELRVSFWPAGLRLLEPVLVLPADGRLRIGEVDIAVELLSLLRGSPRLLALRARGPVRLTHRGMDFAGEVKADLSPADAPFEWSADASVELTSGGSLVARGALPSGGGFDGTLELIDVESAPFAGFLASASNDAAELIGRYSGRLTLDEDGRDVVTLRIESEGAEVFLPPLRVEGPIVLVAELPAADSVSGRFQVDATRARVEYAGGPTKATGEGASVGGRILRRAGGGFRVDEVAMKVVGFRAQLDDRSEATDAR